MTIKRIVRETLLIVAEGDAEVAFVRHLKVVYRSECRTSRLDV
jgi:hypothetical protein